MTLISEAQTFIVPTCRHRAARPLAPMLQDEIFQTVSFPQEGQNAAEHSDSSAYERRDPIKEAKSNDI